MTLELFPHNTSIPRNVASAEIDEICQQIADACKGFGTNEKKLLQALGSVSQKDRYKVPLRYEQMFAKNLRDVVKSECGSRPFGKTLQYLSVNPIIAECDMIHDTFVGLGMKEFILTTIICGRSNREIDILKKEYFDRYGKDLGSVIAGETKGSLEQLLLNSLQGMQEVYNSSIYDDDRMNDDIKKLQSMGLGRMGTDEAGIFKFLCFSPPEYLKKINIAFAGDDGITLSKALEKELSGDTEAAASFIMGIKIKPYQQIAKVLEKSFKGFGTDEALLQVTLIRYQGIMKEVKSAYVDLYGKTIQDSIKAETSGDYEDLLQLIVGE